MKWRHHPKVSVFGSNIFQIRPWFVCRHHGVHGQAYGPVNSVIAIFIKNLFRLFFFVSHETNHVDLGWVCFTGFNCWIWRANESKTMIKKNEKRMMVKKGGILAGFRVEKLLERGYKFFWVGWRAYSLERNERKK